MRVLFSVPRTSCLPWESVSGSTFNARNCGREYCYHTLLEGASFYLHSYTSLVRAGALNGAHLGPGLLRHSMANTPHSQTPALELLGCWRKSPGSLTAEGCATVCAELISSITLLVSLSCHCYYRDASAISVLGHGVSKG